MGRYVFFILLWQMLFPGFMNAQPADYRLYKNIGLGSEASVISCILQDTEGLIWAGSNKGLLCYDGYSVQSHFTFGKQSNTRVYCGQVVDSTYLYLGADNGLLIYNYRTDSYEDVGISFPSDIRTMVLCDSVLWLGSLHGLYMYNPVSHTLSARQDGIPHKSIYSIIRSSDNCLYIGTYNGCCRYVSATGHFETVELPDVGGKSNLFVNSLLEDKARGCIWIGTEGCLFKYGLADGKVSRIDDFDGNSVKSLALDGYGQLLVGTDNGMYVYAESAPLRHVVHDSRNAQSLSSNIVWTIFVDSEKNVWLGTDYGISMTRHANILQYTSISQITGTGEGNQFYALLRDAKGAFWMGGTNGLIRFTFPRDEVLAGTLQEVTSERITQDMEWYKMGDRHHLLPHNRVRQLYEDRDGHLWAATDGSICRYDTDLHRFITYNIVDSTRSYNSNWAYSLFEDNQGKLWVATCLGGIFVVDKQKLLRSTDRLYMAEKTYTVHNGLSGMFINQMTVDHEGNVWALLYNSQNCIEKINPRTGQITHVASEILKDAQYPNYILCSEDGYIWVGFPGGVMRIAPADNDIRMLSFDANNHNEVLSMVEAKGKIWISATDGFWVVNKQTFEVRCLNITDQRFTGMFYDRRDDKLYLGMVDGYAASEPDKLLAEYPERPLMLTALYVNNQFYKPDGKTTSGSIRYAREVTLEHDRNNLAFEFSDLPYSQEEKNKFVYRLEGLDNGWSQLSGNANRIMYSNLKYGDYKLLVDKSDAYGLPVGEEYALAIRIFPPWYYTGWAKAIYAFLVCVLIVWTFNFFWVKNRLKLAQLEKEKVLEQSRAKMEFFTNLSHDFKTPLSMIIAPVSRMLPSIEDAWEKKQLELVQRNAMKLNALIHKGLDFNRVDSGQNPLLIMSQIELVSFARELYALYAEGKVGGKELHYTFHTNRDRIYVQLDAVKLESVLDNLLSNAVKYTPEGGLVTLSIEVSDGEKEVSIAVTDTGIGISRQDQPYIFQRFFQSSRTAGKKEGTGIGLYLVKTYTELQGGHVRLVSEENIGTTVTLTFPVWNVEQTEASQTVADLQQSAVPDDAPLILIVDDNQDVTGFIFQILCTRYRCHIAQNGKEGLEVAMHLLPDVIISDVMMPVMDGFEMVKRLRKHVPTSTIPVILLTAKNDKETELESNRLYVEAFIAKPFEPDILLSRVEQLLFANQNREAKARMELISTPEKIEAESYDEKFLANITHLIEEHISESELNVNTLCEWAGVNNKQMYRKIKQLTGMTPVEYIKSIRMKKAAMLLEQRKFSVAEVMYMVGFSNHSYFSKCFQAAFGVTPKQY